MTWPTPQPPGWYPDPHGAAGQRWFDGERYTEHFVPARPPIYPPGQTVVVGGTNHALHAILTIFTCGLWAPIWVLVAIFERPRVYVPAVVTPAPPGWYSNPNGQGTRYWDGRTWTIVSIPYTPPPRPVVVERPGSTILVVIAAIVGSLLVLGVLAAHWQVLAALVLVACVLTVVWARSGADNRTKRTRRARFDQEIIAARADFEHMLWMRGDPRGFYGRYPPYPTGDARTDTEAA